MLNQVFHRILLPSNLRFNSIVPHLSLHRNVNSHYVGNERYFGDIPPMSPPGAQLGLHDQRYMW